MAVQFKSRPAWYKSCKTKPKRKKITHNQGCNPFCALALWLPGAPTRPTSPPVSLAWGDRGSRAPPYHRRKENLTAIQRLCDNAGGYAGICPVNKPHWSPAQDKASLGGGANWMSVHFADLKFFNETNDHLVFNIKRINLCIQELSV